MSPPSFTVSSLGQANDAALPSIHRDGGGGGVLNNKNWIIFSDTVTGNSFASNTYAVVRYKPISKRAIRTFLKARLTHSVRSDQPHKSNRLPRRRRTEARRTLGTGREQLSGLHLAQHVSDI